ncbi:hypothetical protein BpHYR1_051254 [Brachionus plicatilis]|uniref:Uncharacterized protein n=1 Tax=Brachionus plicatilis TaxID=10195 RepID=A0A3M7T8Y2_BRAPC|nr:hypothetical protein BpHYR1_051254 [Brachionus plicatilis]
MTWTFFWDFLTTLTMTHFNLIILSRCSYLKILKELVEKISIKVNNILFVNWTYLRYGPKAGCLAYGAALTNENKNNPCKDLAG